MISSLRKLIANNKEFGLAAGLVILSFIILVLPINIKRPLAKYTYIVSLSPFQGLSEDLKQLSHTVQINRHLRKQLMERELELSFAREALAQNSRLRDSLGFRERREYELIPAELEAIDPKRRENAIIVSVASGSSVQADMAVMGVSGLVGKTTNVLGNNVTVELLTSPSCRVAGRSADNRALGIIRWESGLYLHFDNVPIRDSVEVGDTIISSGLGGLFPDGLPIGTIVSIDVPEKGFFKQIDVKPFVDFNRLDEVFILKEEDD